MNFNKNIPSIVYACFFQNASNCLNPFRSLIPGLYFIVVYFYLILYVQKIHTTPPPPQAPPPIKTENTLLDTVSIGILHTATPFLTLFKHS